MAEVRFEKTTRRFAGSDKPAVDALDLDVADEEFLVLVGPSGCGKTTSLRMLAGLETIDEGAIYIDGRDVTGLTPRDRDIAMVFQNYALYPHMSVADNMGFALKVAGVDKEERNHRVHEPPRCSTSTSSSSDDRARFQADSANESRWEERSFASRERS